MDTQKRRLEAVFLDLDGTLLNTGRQIGEEDKKTVARLQKAGVKVYIATGRHYELSVRYYRELGLTGPFLCSDGAALYEPKERRLLYHHPIPAPLVRAILRAATAMEQEFYIHDASAVYFSPNFGRLQFWQDYADSCGPGDLHPALGPLPGGYIQGEPEVMTFMTRLPSPPFQEALRDLCRGVAPLYIHPEGFNAVVNPPGWNKGEGVRYLAKEQGISLRNVLAMGDTHNDFSMLAAVGWPVAPKNGDPGAKALAKFVTTDNDHQPLTVAVKELFPEVLRQ